MKKLYRWSGMKRDISIHISRCATCQQVKADHQKTAGLLQPLEIPNLKWDQISMDYQGPGGEMKAFGLLLID